MIKYLRDGATPVFCAKDILIEYYSTHSHKLDVDKIIGDYINQRKLENRPQKIKTPKREITEEKNELSKEQYEQKLEVVKQNNDKLISSFDENQLLVYNKLCLEPKFIDELSFQCGLDVGTILSILTEFEILDVASSYSGRRYALKSE